MGQRLIRVNELVKREISDVLHTRYQSESVYITVSEVIVAPDLRNARVFYSVLGDDEQRRKAGAFLKNRNFDIRRQLSKRIVLKYLPHLHFIFDQSIERGSHLNDIMDELGMEDEGLEGEDMEGEGMEGEDM